MLYPLEVGAIVVIALAVSNGGCSLLFEAGQPAEPPSSNDGGNANDSGVSDRWAQSAYLKALNAGEGDQLSNDAVALSADGLTLVVGASFEQGSGTSIDAEHDDDAPAAGAAYVFIRSGATWTQQAYLKASIGTSNDRFGQSVAISDDGNTVAVGASKTELESDLDVGAVYIFSRTNNAWSQQAPLRASDKGPDGRFGLTVKLSGDGKTLAVASDGTDERVYVFSWEGEGWNEFALIRAPNSDSNDNFGDALALSANGQTIAVGAWGEDSGSTGIGNADGDSNLHQASGAAYVFTRDNNFATARAYIKASNTDAQDSFGYSVALNGLGTVLAVGARGEASGETGVDGEKQDNNNNPKAGAVYVFALGSTVWTQQAYIKASNTGGGDRFGTSLALSKSGLVLAVGADSEESEATGIDGDQFNDTLQGAGAGYLFVYDGTSWAQSAYIKASNTGEDDDFGTSVSLSADAQSLVYGARGEASAAGGDAIDQDDDTAPSTGAAYVFTRE